ncbi:MAG: rRNA pseudouridine synthase [Actinobacteria bacterium]|nr:rRNA pseudouridine synthase [Actinomycetota bacterium]
MVERLQKMMAYAGVGSRRYCEELIRQGRVQVGGRKAHLGMSVDPTTDVVTVDGKPVRREPLEYWVLNKPRGTICTANDPRGRPTVVDMVPAQSRVYPVGRLDWDTTGVILLTNDGEVALRLAHPRFGVEKEYLVDVRGCVSLEAVRTIRRGTVLDDGPTMPVQVTVVSATPMRSTLRLVLREGRNRQVRRMLETVGYKVLALHRCRIGDLDDGRLPVGGFRRLGSADIRRLRASIGLDRSVS